jgi:hypothetical protein
MIGKTLKDLMNLGNKPLKAQRLKHVYLLSIKRLRPEAYLHLFNSGSQIPNLELLRVGVQSG